MFPSPSSMAFTVPLASLIVTLLKFIGGYFSVNAKSVASPSPAAPVSSLKISSLAYPLSIANLPFLASVSA
jgi:hypothetical protein